MDPLESSDIRNLHEYELERAAFRAHVIALKSRRRLPLGPLMTLVFENRDTVRFQIQEMLRVERIVQPDRVEHEIETYNALLPGPGEVAATLFIEITDPARIREVLDAFVGLDEPGRLVLRVGARRFPARFDPAQSREDRVSAVQYVRFALEEEGAAALRRGEDAALEVAHGDYRAAQPLPRETLEELLADLAGGSGFLKTSS
jgi:hypothetical protein